MKDNNCIFCKLANGDIPTNSIYEDENYKIILDANPTSRGHCLILPKDHYKNLYELPDEKCSEVLRLARRMSVEIKEKLGADGINIVQNNEEAAGQTVFHFHMHIIPRYSSEGNAIIFNQCEANEEDLKKITEIFK